MACPQVAGAATLLIEQHAVDGLVGRPRVDAIRDLRNYIFGLRPGILADRQLDDAIRELCAESEKRSGVVTIRGADVHRSPRR